MRLGRIASPDGVAFVSIEGEVDDPDGMTVREIAEHPFGTPTFTGRSWPLADVRLLAPILASKVVCVGKNYADHIAEMGGQTGPAPADPVIFLKPNTAIVGPNVPIRLPANASPVHFEGELAVVVGRPCKDVSAAEAADSILGYTVGNDVSARDQQKADGQWTRAKGHDSFCPVGPWIVTDLDPADLELRTEVNGDVKQDSRTSLMIHDVGAIVEWISAVMTLLPGDLILTGTPAGVGPDRGRRHRLRHHRGNRHPHQSRSPQRKVVTAPSVRVRFCPSPTGTPHVGMVRTASVQLGLRPPHRRHVRLSHRGHRRRSATARKAIWRCSTRCAGSAWTGTRDPRSAARTAPTGSRSAPRSTATWWTGCSRRVRPTRPFRRRKRSRRATSPPAAIPKLGYDNFDRDLTDAQRAAYLAEGRKPVVRLRMPDADLSWNDLVRGTTTFAAGSVPDFALTRASGDPLYTLVNPCDDALMKITHVLRGEDLLPSTPRQLALYQALIRIGVAERIPEFAHLPTVLGEGTKKLSKRDPQSNLFAHRDRGFIPEGLLNYLALLGWAIADDHDLFSLDEMVAAFDVVDVNSNPARFDQKKADALNAEHIRMLDRGRLRRPAARLLRDTRPRHRARRARTSPRPPIWCRPASSCSATRGTC